MKIFITAIYVLLLATSSYAEQIDRDIVGCNTEKKLKELLSYVESMDYTSYQNMLRCGECIGLKKGTIVKTLDIGSFTSAGNTIRLKVKGRKREVWTLQEAVK